MKIYTILNLVVFFFSACFNWFLGINALFKDEILIPGKTNSWNKFITNELFCLVCFYGKEEFVKYMLQNSYLDAACFENKPLRDATANSHIKVVELLQKEANANLATSKKKKGKTMDKVMNAKEFSTYLNNKIIFKMYTTYYFYVTTVWSQAGLLSWFCMFASI